MRSLMSWQTILTQQLRWQDGAQTLNRQARALRTALRSNSRLPFCVSVSDNPGTALEG